MNIDDQLLSHLEKLAHLEVAPDKKKAIEGQLSEILGFVENLSELDTEGVDPSFTMTPESNRLREDIPASDPEVTEITLKNAPDSDGSAFIVPKIIE